MVVRKKIHRFPWHNREFWAVYIEQIRENIIELTNNYLHVEPSQVLVEQAINKLSQVFLRSAHNAENMLKIDQKKEKKNKSFGV
jgi:hypothetical protein